MIPTGGFYLIIHLIIIGAVKAFRIIRERTVPTIIIILVVTGASYGVVKAVQGALDENSNLHLYRSLVDSCEPYEEEERPGKIILRIDDIQANNPWEDGQFRMLRELEARNITATLAVIPRKIKSDKEIYYYLKNHNCNFEIALHGWENSRDGDYNLSEFGLLSRGHARERINRGLEMLKPIAGKDIVTFVPPNNEYSYGTKKALIEAGFKVISSEGKHAFDYTVSTYDFLANSLNPVSKVLNECFLGLETNDLCIIMIHPQDYYTEGLFDGDKFDTFLNILDKLEKFNAEFTTFGELQNWSNFH